ncbi:two-component regulator propeller domain-containing protein [uncultured Shimia sp.]|uniref:two-component regulator propeller domain-containing protein n=1 Tax=uncultured Shimia sp. TaxID=573152 RepID=UPI0025FE1A6A|nr:two-component regulator propeller domain-containing protein [uncultured Shimia sp.]
MSFVQYPNGLLFASKLIFCLALSLCTYSVTSASETQVFPKYELDSGSVTVGGLEDSDGIIWLATAIGPLRYNGVDTQYLKTGNGTRLSRVGSIFEAADGKLWFGRASGGVVVYDKRDNSFQTLKHSPGEPNSLSTNSLNWAPHLIQQTGDGDMWIGTTNGLNRVSEDGEQVTHYQHNQNDKRSLAGNNIHAVEVDQGGRVWIATDNGLSALDTTSGEFTNYRHDPNDPQSLPAGKLSDVLAAQPGVIWVSSHSDGLARLDVATGAFKRYQNNPENDDSLAHNEIYSLEIDATGNLWIGRRFSVAVGIEEFNPETGHFHVHLRNPDTASPDTTEMIMSAFVGHDGTVWLPYNTGPLYRMVQPGPVQQVRFKNPTAQSIHTEPVLAVAEDADSQVWIGGVGGLKLYDRDTGSYERWQPESDAANPEDRTLTFNEVNTILPAGPGLLWIGEVDSTFSLVDTQKKKVLKRHRTDQRAFGAWGGTYDVNDPSLIWFGSQTSGLGRVDTNTGEFRFYNSSTNPEAGIKTSFIAKVAPAASSGLWLASDGQGVLFFDNEKVVEQYLHEPENPGSLGSSFVNDIEFDSDGQMWVATMEGGLSVFDQATKTFETFGAEAGLLTSNVLAIEIDGVGNLWLATNEGVYLFNPRTKQVERRFTDRDNLHTNSSLTWPSGTLMTSAQELFVGSLSGVSMIALEKFSEVPENLLVLFTRFTVNGQPIQLNSAIERVREFDVHGPDASFDFNASVLGYSHEVRKRIRYKLEGYETEWNTPSNTLYGRYTSLPGGSYFLVVQGSQQAGKWTSGARVKVNVIPAWWQRWWFITFLLLTSFGLLIAVAYWRLRILQAVVESTKALAKSEERTRDIAETAFDYFFETDKDHKIIWMSDQFQEATGITPENVYGKTRWDVTSEDTNTSKWVDHRSEIDKNMPFRDFQFELAVAGGTPRVILGNGNPIYSEDGEFLGYMGTGKDVTDVVRAIEGAQAAENRLKRAIESANASILVFDSENNLVFSHLAEHQKLDELRKNISVGMSYKEHIRDALVPSISFIDGVESDQFFDTLMKNHNHPGAPLEVRLNDDTWLQLNETALEDGGAIQVWIDSTELKLHEEQARRSQKMDAIGKLTGGIAHDFNNLLAVIHGNLELLLDEVPDKTGKPRRYVDKALAAASKGANLTQRLLAFARKQPLRPEATDINNLVEGMISLVRRTLGEEVKIVWEPDPKLKLGHIDANQLESAVLNLAVNARDALQSSGELRVATSNVTLSETDLADNDEVAPGEYVAISFKDNGTGMSQDVQDRIFEPFFTTKEMGKGTGLGLSMIYGFIKQSKGHISCESELGQGTTMTLYLKASDQDVVAATSVDAKTDTAAKGRLRVLVVEDDVEVRSVITEMLASFGYSVLAAEDSFKALEILEKPADIDLMLTDIGLPGGMNGIQLADKVRQEHPTLPIVMMTGYQSEQENGEGFAAPAQNLIHKPFSKADLSTAIERAI